MTRLVVQGASGFAPARCAVCTEELSPHQPARLVGRKLAHRDCSPAACSVCEELFDAVQLDSSERCDECRP